MLSDMAEELGRDRSLGEPGIHECFSGIVACLERECCEFGDDCYVTEKWACRGGFVDIRHEFLAYAERQVIYDDGMPRRTGGGKVSPGLYTLCGSSEEPRNLIQACHQKICWIMHTATHPLLTCIIYISRSISVFRSLRDL